MCGVGGEYLNMKLCHLKMPLGRRSQKKYGVGYRDLNFNSYV